MWLTKFAVAMQMSLLSEDKYLRILRNWLRGIVLDRVYLHVHHGHIRIFTAGGCLTLTDARPQHSHDLPQCCYRAVVISYSCGRKTFPYLLQEDVDGDRVARMDDDDYLPQS